MRDQGQSRTKSPAANFDPYAASIAYDIEPPPASSFFNKDGEIGFLAAYRRNRHQVAQELDLTGVTSSPQRDCHLTTRTSL